MSTYIYIYIYIHLCSTIQTGIFRSRWYMTFAHDVNITEMHMRMCAHTARMSMSMSMCMCMRMCMCIYMYTMYMRMYMLLNAYVHSHVCL